MARSVEEISVNAIITLAGNLLAFGVPINAPHSVIAGPILEYETFSVTDVDSRDIIHTIKATLQI
jgi:hypothetical protein